MIVIVVEMDYHGITGAPGWLTDTTVGENAPYAVAAGLGEAARNGPVFSCGIILNLHRGRVTCW